MGLILARFWRAFGISGEGGWTPQTPALGTPLLDRPWGFHEVEAPRFQDNRNTKVVRLSALRTGHLYPPGNIPCTHFCYKLNQTQRHNAAGRIDTIGNRTPDLPACSAVSQPNAPLNIYTCTYCKLKLRSPNLFTQNPTVSYIRV